MKAFTWLWLLLMILGSVGAVVISIAFTVDIAWKLHGYGKDTWAIMWGLWGAAWVCFWVGKAATWIAQPLQQLNRMYEGHR